MRITTGLLVCSMLALLPSYATQSNDVKANLLAKIANKPLGFEPNRGQARADVDYVASTAAGTLYLKSTGALLVVPRRDPLSATTLEMNFGGARSSAKAEPEIPVPGFSSSYFIGNDPSQWITGLREYGKVRYRDVWPGVDVVYYGNGGRLEYDFVVAPGTNPSAIQMRFSGMDSIRLTAQGALELDTAAGLVYQPAPDIYQMIGGIRRKVNGHYVLSGNEARFQIAKYDRTKPLVIDPILVYSSTSLSTVQGNAVAVDSTGRMYLTGMTVPRLPAPGASAVFDVYLWIFDSAGNQLYYQEWGGNGHTFGNALAVDSNLNVYVAGSTLASNLISQGGFQPTFGGNFDGFLTKFVLQNGSAGAISYVPVYSTYIGGAGNDSANAVAFDSTGKAYVAGTTSSSNFPVTAGASYRAAVSAAFLVKVDPSIQSGSGSLLYSTLIGGAGTDTGASVAVDASLNAYVAGSTTSPTAPPPGFLPVASTGFAPSKLNTNPDGYILKLNASGAATNLTFFANGPINGIALGTDNSVYATGQTFGGIPVNSVTAGYLTGAQGGTDAFLAKFDPTLSTLAYSTYLGGTGNDVGNSVAVDSGGNAVIVGQTSSANFPSTTTGLLGSGTDTLPDVFVSRIRTSASGSISLSFSALMGGDGADEARSVALDGAGNIYATGDTASTNFPPSTGQPGTQRAFATKINPNQPPQVLPVSPSSGSGNAQTFTFGFSDVNGAANITWAQFLINSGFSATNACYLSFSPRDNAIYLFNDAASAGQVMTLGTAGTLQNSQCSVNVGASSMTASGNNVTLNLALGFKSTFGGARNVYAIAGNANGLQSGWQTLGTWTVPGNANLAPQVLQASPASGSGTSQTFSFVFSDPNGFADIAWAQLIVNSSFGAANACYLSFSPRDRAIYLFNDAASSGQAMTLGTAGTLQNSQCSINVGASSMTGSGNNLTLSLAVSFKAAFAGAKNIYGLDGDTAGLQSGWQTAGTWTVTGTVNQAPQVLPVSPASGSGTSQTFSFVFSDPNGFADIAWAQLIVNSSFGGANACYLSFSPRDRAIYLFNDAASSGQAMTLGTAGTLQNSQCSINVGASSMTGSGNNLTLSLAVSFKAAFAGAKNIYALDGDTAGLQSGWQTAGTWTVTGTVNQAPQVLPASPASGSGTSQTFSFVFSDPNGFADIVWAQLIVNSSFGGANACYFSFSPHDNAIYLFNDAASAGQVMTLGTAGTLQNSQCSINVGASSMTGSGNNLTLSLAVSFKAAFAGAKNIYALDGDTAGLQSGWQTAGTWTVTGTVNQAPQVLPVSPASGSGTSQTFSFVFSDPNGFADIAWAQVIVNSSFGAANACYFSFSPHDNAIYLFNDAASAGQVMTLGTAGTLQNSQCSINVGASSMTGSGNNVTLNLAVSFKAAFAGAKNIYALDGDTAGLQSGWQTSGTWTVTGTVNQAPQVQPVSPASGSGTSQVFSFVFSDPNGFADIAWAQVLIRGTFGAANACYFSFSPHDNAIYLFNDAASSGQVMTLGTAGTLQNSQCSINVGASSMTGSGNNVTLSLAVSFKAAFAGAKNIYGLDGDAAGMQSGWQTLGTWTAQ